MQQIYPHVDQDTNVPTGSSTSARSFRVKLVLQ